MKERTYEIKLEETRSIQIEQAQTAFMSAVFKKAEESGIPGHGLEITLVKVSDAMDQHPELRGGEMFLSNADDEHYPRIKWKTKRRGEVAYDRNGYIVEETPNLRPVFVQRDEYVVGMKKHRKEEKEE